MILKAGTSSQPKNDYPTSDGKPMAETDLHRDLMHALIETLKWWYRGDPRVYVSGNLYVGKLGVKEYFLFDPREEYLKPSFQGYRKAKDRFRPIKPVAGRFPSKVLGLHLERLGTQLRLWNPADGMRVPTPGERAFAEAARAEAEADRAETEAARADDAKRENARLRREIELLRNKRNGK